MTRPGVARSAVARVRISSTCDETGNGRGTTTTAVLVSTSKHSPWRGSMVRSRTPDENTLVVATLPKAAVPIQSTVAGFSSPVLSGTYQGGEGESRATSGAYRSSTVLTRL